MHQINVGRLQIADFSLYYETVGAGPAIVFAHGLGGNHLSWWNQVPYFMRWFTCVTLDQRGFGLSPDSDGSFNLSHPDDLSRLLDHLEIDRAILVGQSMGGWTVVGCALKHPDRVAALVMAGTYGGIDLPDLPELRGAAAMPSNFSPPIGSMPTYARDYFARSPELAYLYDDLRILGARPPEDAIARIGRLRHPLALVREKLTMPILCIVGEEDALMPERLIRELAKSLRDSRLVTIPHCGHSTYFECPEVFNQSLLQFARSIGFGG